MNAPGLPVTARAKSSACRSIRREKPFPSGSAGSPPRGRGVREEDEFFNPPRPPPRGVGPAEPLHRSDERPGVARHGQGEVVRLPLDPAREAVSERERGEREDQEHEREPRHPRGVGGSPPPPRGPARAPQKGPPPEGREHHRRLPGDATTP